MLRSHGILSLHMCINDTWRSIVEREVLEGITRVVIKPSSNV